MLKFFATLLTLIIVAGCGSADDTAKSERQEGVTTAIPQDSEVSLTAASAAVSGKNGSYTLTYTDTQSGLETAAPLQYDQVFNNQITVIYEGVLPAGVVYQSDLDASSKIGLYTSGATSADAYAADLARLNSASGVLLAEPNYTVTGGEVITAAYVNDPDYDKQWGLQKIGIETAWEKTTGSSDIVVAVIDTGIDYTHEELAANIWHNQGEIAGNGIDDDGNGLIDDTMGYDFANRDNDPFDDNRHGTHCAGIIGAKSDNTVGIAGVSPNVSLMPIKVLSENGAGSTLNIYNGFRYAVDNGARIISMSLGGYGFSYLTYYGAYYAYKNNVLVVAAAGNESNNNDTTPVYPAGFPFSNIIAVAASNGSDTLSSFSNYGSRSVDIAAPGENIYSTIPNNGYAYLSGTSMATPFVTGAAVLTLAMDETLTHIKTREYILENAQKSSTLTDKVYSGGRMDVGTLVEDPDLQQVLTVVSLIPEADATDVDVDSKIRIYFNRSIDANTVSNSSIILKDSSGSQVSGSFSLNQTIVIFTPDEALRGDTRYTMTLKKSLLSSNGYSMESDYIYSFTTEETQASESTELPDDGETNVLDAATDVSVYAKVSFTFSTPLSIDEIKEIQFLMKESSGAIIAGKLAYGYGVLTFTPSQALKPDTRYLVSLSIASRGISETFSFTTGSG